MVRCTCLQVNGEGQQLEGSNSTQYEKENREVYINAEDMPVVVVRGNVVKLFTWPFS